MRTYFAALILICSTAAHADFREFKNVPVDPSLETKVRHAAEATLKDFPKLGADNLGISLIDVTNPATVGRGDYHGDAPFSPASVVKLFFMTEVFHQRKETFPDMQRALHDMISVSNNDAAAYIVDVLTDTSSGPPLEGRALRTFMDRRAVVTRWFRSMGYDVSAMSKTWAEDYYGRDVQVLGPNKENLNRASANAIASLLLWIERRRAVSLQASDAMLALLQRPIDVPRPGENQVKTFIGEALPAGSKLWSKAGWTSKAYNDAAIVQLPNGRKLILVIMTRGLVEETQLIPTATRHVLSEISDQLITAP